MMSQRAFLFSVRSNAILYTVYDKGTTFPPGQETSGNEHMQTWKVAYYNQGIRDWLFAEHKA